MRQENLSTSMDTTKATTVTSALSWSAVTFAGACYVVRRSTARAANVVVFAVYEPSTVDGPHAHVEHHPELGCLGRVGSQRFPGSPSPQAVGAKERQAQLDSYRTALCVLVRAVLYAATPDVHGYDVHPTHCHIEITLH